MQPEAGVSEKAPRVAAIVLAAGRSTRMGDTNKLLADIGGTPMVRRVVEAALASKARPVLVVTGHERSDVAAALSGLDVTHVANPDYATGLAELAEGGRARASSRTALECSLFSAICRASRPSTSTN